MSKRSALYLLAGVILAFVVLAALEGAASEGLNLTEVEISFMNYVDETLGLYAIAQFTKEAMYHGDDDFELEVFMEELRGNLLFGLYPVGHRLPRIAEHYPEAQWTNHFSWLLDSVLQEIELAVLVTNPDTNAYDIRNFVESKSLDWFGGGKWSDACTEKTMLKLGFSYSGEDGVVAYNKELAERLTRDQIVEALYSTESSITGYLEMTEQDPR